LTHLLKHKFNQLKVIIIVAFWLLIENKKY